jgi:hypothetical protein
METRKQEDTADRIVDQDIKAGSVSAKSGRAGVAAGGRSLPAVPNKGQKIKLTSRGPGSGGERRTRASSQQ